MKMSLINKRGNLNKRASRSSSQVLTGFARRRAHQSQARAETAAVSHPFLKDEFEKDLESRIILNARDVHYILVNNIAKKVFDWRLTRAKPDKETGSECLTHAKADWDALRDFFAEYDWTFLEESGADEAAEQLTAVIWL